MQNYPIDRFADDQLPSLPSCVEVVTRLRLFILLQED